MIFIAVGTPPRTSGEADLSYLEATARSIGSCMVAGRYRVVVNKSTVPVGSGNLVETLVREGIREAHPENEEDFRFGVASNPEFLREGCALSDSLYPERVVVGAEEDRALASLRQLYRPLIDQRFDPPPCLPRRPGFIRVPLVITTLTVNRAQRQLVIQKLQEKLLILKGRNIALLGLTFKPNSDDLRDAPSLQIAQRLLQTGARVKAYDPIAMPACRAQHRGLKIQYCASALEAATDADALVLVTDWDEFRNLDLTQLARAMAQSILVDGRNLYEPSAARDAGFDYTCIGRPHPASAHGQAGQTVPRGDVGSAGTTGSFQIRWDCDATTRGAPDPFCLIASNLEPFNFTC